VTDTKYEPVVSKWLDTDLSNPPYVAIAMVCNEHRELVRRVKELERKLAVALGLVKA
jgi:uncharacterized protein YhaN